MVQVTAPEPPLLRAPVPRLEGVAPLPARLDELVRRFVVNEADRRRPPDLFGGGADERFADAVYVGRDFAGRIDTGWGNPMRLGRRSRGEVLVAYTRWLCSAPATPVELRARLDAGELTGRVLSCWCHPQPCHAWVLAGFANGAGDEVCAWVEATASAHRAAPAGRPPVR